MDVYWEGQIIDVCLGREKKIVRKKKKKKDLN
jgi:hypothetical protein